MSHWLVWYSRCGPACYLSHLDTVRALLRTFARAGIGLALTEGYRPKPRVSLPLPLPVGAAGMHELVVATVGDPAPPATDALRALQATAPPGIAPIGLEVVATRPRPRPALARYECDVLGDAGKLMEACEWFALQEEITVERVSPKGHRSLDLKRYVQDLAARAAADGVHLAFAICHRGDGAARPKEVVDLIAGRAGCAPVMHRLTRSSVSFEGLPRDVPSGGEE